MSDNQTHPIEDAHILRIIPPMATGPVEVEVAVEHAPSSASTDFLASLTPNEAGQSAEREEDNGLSQ